MTTPLLSIAIPTHHRLPWLRQSLRKVLDQVAEHPAGRVEVLVSENAGSDGSWEYLTELARSEPALRIRRNDRNLGAEGNIYLLPALATGEYLWLLGDDDFLQPGGLAKILALLGTGSDYVVLNFRASDENHQREGVPAWSLAKDTPVASVRSCCSIVPHFTVGFLSAWVARRSLFNNVSQASYDHFRQWGLSVMADRYVTLAKASRGVVVADPLLATRRPPANEYPATFEYFDWFFTGSALLLEYLETASFLPPDIVRERKLWLLRKIAPKRILFERSAGTFDRPGVAQILSSHYRLWPYWLLCLPAMYFPGLGAIVSLVRSAKHFRLRPS